MTDYSKRILSDGSIEMEATGDNTEGRIVTLKDLLQQFEINEEEYDVKSFTPNSWETSYKDKYGVMCKVTNYSAKARLERNHNILTAERISEIFQEMVSRQSCKRIHPKVKRRKKFSEATTVIMDLFDLHIGMLAWAEETQGEDWDSYIGVEVALEAIDDLISRLDGMNITKIILPMGNDLLHTDTTIAGKGGATSNGTPQDIDSRYLKMFRMAAQLMISFIDKLRLIAPVEVIVVPGNHDRERAAYIGEFIFAWYKDDKEVIVNNSASLRKYTVVGNTLLGFTHGDGEKPENLPLIMASEEPKAWGEAKFKIFHTGHFHRKRKMMTVTTDTYTGVEVITLPSLVPPDAWHAMKGFVGGGRAAEAHLIGEESGPCGYFRHNVFGSNG